MIHFDIHNRIGHLVIEADGRNALSGEDLRTMAAIVEEQTELVTIDGLVLSGANGAFSSGLMLDTSEGAPSKSEQFAVLRPLLDRVLVALCKAPFPVVAAVSGHAIAGGLLLLAAADKVLLLDNPRAKFGMPEVMIDLSIDSLMADVLKRTFSPLQIRSLLYSGDYVHTDVLLRWGVADALCPSEEEMQTAAESYIQKLQPHISSFHLVKQQLAPDWE